MRETIDQFMWGYQQHFRWGVGYETQRVLNEIGIPVVDITAVLVGFATEQNARHAICVEPETGPLQSEHLTEVASHAVELYHSNPESEMFHSHPQVHESRHRQIFLQSRANTIASAIEKSGVFGDITFFVSQSSPINGYEVHSCIGIPTGLLNELPAFKDSTVDRFHVGQSLQHEVIQECLYRADQTLYLPDPGVGLSMFGRPDDIITTATDRFLSGTMMRVDKMPSDIFRHLNAITSLTYERAAAKGNLVITAKENIDKWLAIRFNNPVGLSQSRAMRKILQLSDNKMAVLADRERAYGLGPTKTAPDVVEASITGHNKWEVSVNGDRYVRVAYGKATIPHRPIELEELEDVVRRIIGETNTHLIWKIVQAAQESSQGTMIVVSADPEAETARLSSDGMVIEPDYLEPEQIVRLGSVDGAVIVGPDGRCYAFGVILDGVASESGDRSRGARFNSAVRYQNKAAVGSVIIVISDDGTIELLPRLMPKVDKSEVAAVVDEFCEFCDSIPTEGELDGEKFSRLYRRVERFVFYLNEQQCQMVNEKHEQEMQHRLASGYIATIGKELQPDPRMNESYFNDESL